VNGTREKPKPVNNNGTTLDRVGSLFDTDWALIDMAALDGTAAHSAMEQISRRYWPVIYAYARASGCDVHEASDITQGFLCDRVVGGKLLDHADKARGRFRALLRIAVRNYVLDARRRMRGKRATNPRIDSVGEKIEHQPSVTVAPESEFDAQWAAAIIQRVLQRVRREYIEQCQEAHWEVFVGRVVRPMLFGEEPVPYEALVEQFDLSDLSQASNMMIGVKRKFARAMRAEVAQTVENPDDVDAELSDLLRNFERGAA
jgi:DNA-directed RNA polymerase specialized sigma24 family protein